MKLLKTYKINLQQVIVKHIDEYYQEPSERNRSPLDTVGKYLTCVENKKYLGTFSKNTLDEYKKYVYRRYNMLELRDSKKCETLLNEITDEMFYTYFLNLPFADIPKASLTKFKKSFNNIFYTDSLNFTYNSKLFYVGLDMISRPLDPTNFTIDYLEGKIITNLEQSVDIYGLLDVNTLQLEPKLELNSITDGFTKNVYITRDNYIKLEKIGDGYLIHVLKDFIFFTNTSKIVNGQPCSNTYMYLNKGVHYIQEAEEEFVSDLHHNSTNIFNTLVEDLKVNDLKLIYTNTLTNCNIHILDANNYIEATYEFN